MSIIQDLYTVFDREQAKYLGRRSSQGRLVIELRQNLAFLREGLREHLPAQVIVDGLEDSQFRSACERGINLDRLQKRALDEATFGRIREFYRYQGWSTARLIENVYERIAVLKKLSSGAGHIDLRIRLQNLFKLLMVLIAHLDGRQLPSTR